MLELGRSGRTIDHAARCGVGGAGERSAVQPAKCLKDQRNSGIVGSLVFLAPRFSHGVMENRRH